MSLNRQLILDFFEKKELRNLIFVLDGKDQLTPQYDFPDTIKKKAVFFQKPSDMAVTKVASSHPHGCSQVVTTDVKSMIRVTHCG